MRFFPIRNRVFGRVKYFTQICRIFSKFRFARQDSPQDFRLSDRGRRQHLYEHRNIERFLKGLGVTLDRSHDAAHSEEVQKTDVIMLVGDLTPYTEGLVEWLAADWLGASHFLYLLGATSCRDGDRRGKGEAHRRMRTRWEPPPRPKHGAQRRSTGHCATLSTDLLLEGKADEIGAHMRISREFSDFRGAIQHRERYFPTGESVARHRADRAFIEHELEGAHRAGGGADLIMHHAPSPRSSRPWYGSNPIDCAFVWNIDWLTERYQRPLWIHSHVHDPWNETLGRRQLVANGNDMLARVRQRVLEGGRHVEESEIVRRWTTTFENLLAMRDVFDRSHMLDSSTEAVRLVVSKKEGRTAATRAALPDWASAIGGRMGN